MRFTSYFAAAFLAFLAHGSLIQAQSLSIFSGNGQVVQEQFLTAVPMVVLARDAAGRPAANVSVNWSISQGSGTLRNAILLTDANGLASTSFLGTSLPPTSSYLAATITAGSAAGSVSFVVTTVPTRQANGSLAAPPLVELVTPPVDNRSVSGRAGSTLRGAVVVRVIAQSGLGSGQPVPNVGVQIVNDPDPTLPSAMCNGTAGLVLTDLQGLATCDLVLGPRAGTVQLTANAGSIQNTASFTLQVTPGAVCTFALSATAQTFTASGGAGTVSVTTPTGCGWTAVSNASWIAIGSGASGSTNGNVGYMVAPNTGAARSGALLIAGQTYTVSQAGVSGGTPGALSITTGTNLPAATAGQAYAATLAASGGQAPYTWAANGALPPGFALNAATGTLTGTPASVANYSLTATVTDSLGHTQSQTFSLAVLTNSSSLTITTTGLPNGIAGQPYQQALTSSGGCATPFSPVPVFSLQSGALPPGLTLQQIADRAFGIAGTPTQTSTSSFTLAVHDACGNQATANFTIAIFSTAGPSLAAAPTSLVFNARVGGNLHFQLADQTLSITSSGAAVQYTAAAATTNGGNWLVLTNASGTTPGSITVSAVNYTQLAAGTYSGTITITSAAANSPTMIPVTLTVVPAPVLAVNPASLAFTQPASGGTAAQQAISIGSGGTPAAFTATANTLSGGAWLFLNANSGMTPATLLASVNPAGLAPGTYNGSILIALADTTSQAVAVTLTVPASGTLTVSPAALSFTAARGSASPTAQSLAVSSTAGASPFTASAVTASGGNWLSVAPQSGITPAMLSVTVAPAALAVGAYTGTITVTPNDPSILPVNVSVSLTVGQPVATLRSVTNAASFAPGPIAPGEMVTLFGAGLGPQALATSQLDSNGRLASLIAGTQVLFDGLAAPIIYTSDLQVSAIVPYDVFGRSSVVVQVAYAGVVSNSINLRVVDSTPAIFTLNGEGQGAILNQDGTLNFPQSGADPGSYVSLFATGEGQTDPPGANGTIVTADVLPRPRLPVTVQIGGQPADVLYAGGAPGLAAGLLQVNVRLPLNLPRGSQAPVVLTVGNQSSPTVFLSVK